MKYINNRIDVMKQQLRSKWLMPLFACAVFAGTYVLLPDDLSAQDSPKAEKKSKRKRRSAADNAAAGMEYDASAMLKKGIEYLEAQQEERGIKTISQVPLQYPESKAAMKAQVVLGNFYIEKKQYDQAIKRLQKVVQCNDPDVQAEALYKIGVCYFNCGEYNQAFTSLRQVVNKFPGSIYANESYYYIGLCHFSMTRWTQAVEALERVGTSVEAQNKVEKPAEKDAKKVQTMLNIAEAGQRLYVKVEDEDFTVLLAENPKATVKIKAIDTNGDEETMTLEPMGKDASIFLGSIVMEPGIAKKGDGILQTKGGDVVSVFYVDAQTGDGKTNREIKGEIPIVSTATVGFTSGDYQDYTAVIFGGQDVFIRVRDLDMDVTDKPDQVTVHVTTSYLVEKEEDLNAGIKFGQEEQEFAKRYEQDYVLTETGPRTGVFVCTGKTRLIEPEPVKKEEKKDAKKDTADEENAAGSTVLPPDPEGKLVMANGDIVEVVYTDDKHILGNDPVDRKFKAKVVVGEVPNVRSQSREVNDLTVKARKSLIEAETLLRLAQIFKEVGLLDFANDKANSGLEKVEEVMRINSEAPLERALLESAFNTKWELLIVQDKIQEAIFVCTMLIKAFPESELVDRALMKIGEIKIKEGTKESIAEGLNIYNGIIQLPKSDLKPEAQYKIAEVSLQLAEEKAKEAKSKSDNPENFKPDYSAPMAEFRKVADNYPDSPFAGKALEKIMTYYQETEEYTRILEMMDQVFRDYPDAEFLDKMLYAWANAAFRMKRYDLAVEKCEQLVSEYPNSIEAKKAIHLRQQIDEAVNQGADDEEEEEE